MTQPKRTIIAAICCLLVVLPNALRLTAQEQKQVSDHYLQRVVIEFQDEASAQAAIVKVAPLFNDHYRAVSCRWDDNWTSDNPGTRDLMEEFGIRGTWYLNDIMFSPENRPADYTSVARDLLQGGNSIGGHSLTHPFITYFHSNRIFAEMSGVRIAWEAALDKPVVSYAYSFVDLRPEPEGDQVLQRTLDSLSRSGFYHVSEYLSFFDGVDLKLELSPIMPPENNPFDVFSKAVDWAYDDPELTKHYPMITNSMHAWYATPRLEYGYEELRRRFERLVSLKNVWHCNQNEYAAYRRQFKVADLRDLKRQGRIVEFELTRPSILSLNDAVPLTIAVTGVEKQDVVSVKVDEAIVERSDREANGKLLFHIRHHPSQRLPERIGHIKNDQNRDDVLELPPDADFPRFRGGLWSEGQLLKLHLETDKSLDLEVKRVEWRSPIGYTINNATEGPSGLVRGPLKLQKEMRLHEDADLRIGDEHFAVQVDFVLEGKPGRLHLTCRRPGAQPDESFPRDGFSLLGPIPVDQFKLDDFIQSSIANPKEQSWTLPDESTVQWRTDAEEGYVTQAWLNPEYIRTMGTWDAHSPTYVLRSSVHSPKKRTARLITSHSTSSRVLVNGKLLDSNIVELQAGDNHIVIIYPGAELSVETHRLTACYFRLCDTHSGERLRDIRYRPY